MTQDDAFDCALAMMKVKMDRVDDRIRITVRMKLYTVRMIYTPRFHPRSKRTSYDRLQKAIDQIMILHPTNEQNVSNTVAKQTRQTSERSDDIINAIRPARSTKQGQYQHIFSRTKNAQNVEKMRQKTNIYAAPKNPKLGHKTSSGNKLTPLEIQTHIQST